MAYLDHYTRERAERLAKKSKVRTRQLLKGEQRTHVIHAVMDILKDWRDSPFENEGACRAGLRSSFCLEGHRWMLSDLEAGSIVNEALRLIGAKRPTWAQGQREYVSSGECVQCGASISDDLARGAFTHRYCSIKCCRAALLNKEFHIRSSVDEGYRSIYHAMIHLNAAPIECRQCGKSFRRRAVTLPNRGQFCSVACKAEYQKMQTYERICEFCAASFTTGSKQAKYCSSACTNASFRMKNGKHPKTLKVHIFDHLFIVKAPARVKVLNSEVFDGWFERAA